MNLRFLPTIRETAFIQVPHGELYPGGHPVVEPRAGCVESCVTFSEGLVVQPQPIPGHKGGSDVLVKLSLEFRSPRVRRDPFIGE